jgi:nucleoid-associated protein YgaU
MLLCVFGCFITACAVKAPVAEFGDAKAAIDAAEAKGICPCTNQDLLEAVNAYHDAEEMMEEAKKCSPNPIAKSVADNSEQVKSCINKKFCSQTELYEKIREKLVYAQNKAQAAIKSENVNKVLCEELKSQLADLKSQILAIADDMKVAGMVKELNSMLDKVNAISDMLKNCDTASAKTLLNELSVYFNEVKSKLSATNIKKESSNKSFSMYTVKKGDCLWRISKKEYLNPFMWPLIYWANKTQIKDPDLIYPKQIFKINKNYTKSEKTKAIHHAKTRGPWSLFDDK